MDTRQLSAAQSPDFPGALFGRAEPWSADDGLLILDANGSVTFCSRSGAAMLGCEAERVVGRPVTSLLPELPFRAHMPAFNLAFVAGNGNGHWDGRPFTSVDGSTVRLEAFPGGMADAGDRSIVVILKSCSKRSTPETFLTP